MAPSTRRVVYSGPVEGGELLPLPDGVVHLRHGEAVTLPADVAAELEARGTVEAAPTPKKKETKQ